MSDKPKREPVRYVKCEECGAEQPDMGKNVRCEECGWGPMPTAAPRGKEG